MGVSGGVSGFRRRRQRRRAWSLSPPPQKASWMRYQGQLDLATRAAWGSAGVVLRTSSSPPGPAVALAALASASGGGVGAAAASAACSCGGAASGSILPLRLSACEECGARAGACVRVGEGVSGEGEEEEQELSLCRSACVRARALCVPCLSFVACVRVLLGRVLVGLSGEDEDGWPGANGPPSNPDRAPRRRANPFRQAPAAAATTGTNPVAAPALLDSPSLSFSHTRVALEPHRAPVLSNDNTNTHTRDRRSLSALSPLPPNPNPNAMAALAGTRASRVVVVSPCVASSAS